MAYMCDLGRGQTVYLDDRGNQTIITTVSSGYGQQQQSSTSFSPGGWTAPPEIFQTPNGAILKIHSADGDRFIQIQGNSIGVTSGPPSGMSSQQMQVQQVDRLPGSSLPPMQPMQPMQPMKMEDMEMSLNPMEMRIGNMEMRMGSASQSHRRFCSQCGASVKPDDKFCASCGHQLG
jgi:hypothetical protein